MTIGLQPVGGGTQQRAFVSFVSIARVYATYTLLDVHSLVYAYMRIRTAVV